MRRLSEVTTDELKDYLGKCWLTHDGMWFYHTYLDAGMETANRINHEAIKSLAAVEMERAKRVLRVGDGDLKTFEGLRQFLSDAMAMILPQSVYSRARFFFRPPDTVRWEWADGECFAYKAMTQPGVLDEYVCGVIFRIECRLASLGIPYAMEPSIEGCLMNRTGHCRGKFTLSLASRA